MLKKTMNYIYLINYILFIEFLIPSMSFLWLSLSYFIYFSVYSQYFFFGIFLLILSIFAIMNNLLLYKKKALGLSLTLVIVSSYNALSFIGSIVFLNHIFFSESKIEDFIFQIFIMFLGIYNPNSIIIYFFFYTGITSVIYIFYFVILCLIQATISILILIYLFKNKKLIKEILTRN